MRPPASRPLFLNWLGYQARSVPASGSRAPRWPPHLDLRTEALAAPPAAPSQSPGQASVGRGRSTGTVSGVRASPSRRWVGGGAGGLLARAGSRYCHIMVQNSKASKNSKFETGFPCREAVRSVEMGDQELLSSPPRPWLCLSGT